MDKTILIFSLIGCVPFAIGVYFVLADVFKLPTYNASRAISNVAKNQRESTGILEVWISSMAAFFAKHVKMNEFKKSSLEADLRTAGMDMTPEKYQGTAIAYGVFLLAFSLPFYLIIPILGAFLSLVAVIMYFIKSKEIQGRVKHHRGEIEKDLPRLVSTIQKKLTYERGIVGILESFIPSCNTALADELAITCADIRSGNEETAITRLEARVGSPMMSDVCRGLITMVHGDRADVYWQSIGQKFADIERNRLKAQAMKAPNKMRFVSLALLGAFMLTFVVVIGTQLIDSMGIFF